MVKKKKDIIFDFFTYDSEYNKDATNSVFGSNELPAKLLFQQRVKYQQKHPIAPFLAQTGQKLDQFFTYIEEPELANVPYPINFWHPSQASYGRKNVSKDFVFPDQAYYKQIAGVSDSGEPIYVLCFVADAFEDFMEYIKVEKGSYIAEDSFLSTDLKPKRGLEEIENLQNRIYDAHYDAFAKTLTFEYSIDKQIINFDTFLDAFLNLYGFEALKQYPLTKTGILQSNKVGPNVSGLCIELAKDPHDVDDIKRRRYFDSPNYNFYTRAAAEFGFLVDKNAPWRLVANIYSPKMRKYIQNYFQNIASSGYTNNILNHYHEYTGHGALQGVNSGGDSNYVYTTNTVSTNPDEEVPFHVHTITKLGLSIESAFGDTDLIDHTHDFYTKSPQTEWVPQDVFDKFYIKSFESDVTYLRSSLKKMYNTFAREHSTVSVPQACFGQEGSYAQDLNKISTKIERIKRTPITNTEFNTKYDLLFWIKTYVILRLTEIGRTDLVNSTNLNKVLADINSLYYFVDKPSALMYANNYLKQYY